MKKIILLIACIFQFALINAQTKVREKLSLDNCWRFYQGDIAMPVIKGQDMSYGNANAGKAWGAATIESADIMVPFPPSPNEQKLNVLIETGKGQKAGLGGVVTVNALD